MKIRELFETASAGASAAGNFATVSLPLGQLQKRVITSPKNKYKNAAPTYRKESTDVER